MNWTPFLLFALPVAICTQDARATTLAQVHERGYLVAGVVDAASPFGGVADGKATGFDAALIDGFGKSLPIEIHQEPIAPDEMESALSSGKVDIVASSVEVTAPRQGAMNFARGNAILPETQRRWRNQNAGRSGRQALRVADKQ